MARRLPTGGGRPPLLKTLRGLLGEKNTVDEAYGRELRQLRQQRASATEDEDLESTSIPPRFETVRRGTSVELFDFQADLVELITKLVSDSRADRVGLVSLPTGAGKTRTACTACLRLLASGKVSRVLWVAPSNELLAQAISAFKLISTQGEGPDTFIAARFIGAGASEPDGPIVFFATSQLLASRVKSGAENLPRLDLLVFDEAHYALAPSYRRAVSSLRKAGVALVGLTATPGRVGEEETEGLTDLFNNRLLISQRLGRRPIESLREKGILSSVVFRRINFDGSGPGTFLSRRHRRTLPIDQLSSHPGRFAATLGAIVDIPRDERAIVFAGSLEHAAALATGLRAHDISVGVVSGYQEPIVRSRILQSFQEGHIRVLLNKSVLIAGYDCPATRHVFLTVPVSSAIAFEQMVGRASRGPLVGGNSESYVWQLDDMLALHGKPSSYTRYHGNSWF